MKRHLKKYFIPHKENNYHPHILHTKRAVLYGSLFVMLKVFIIGFVAFLPVEVFVLPDVLAEEQKQIIKLTNDVRKNNGRSALSEADKLNASAQLKADDMSAKQYFAHAEDSKTLSSWLHEVGYSYRAAGENLAVGFSSAEDIVNAWVNSPTHYANLVDKDYQDVGVGLSGGIFNGEPTVYIAQHFGKPTPVVAVPSSIKKPVAAVKEQPATKSGAFLKDVVAETPQAQVLAEKVVEPKPEALPLVSKNSQTPVDKYIHARTVLSPVTSIFAVSRVIFLGAMIFFIIALALKIFIQIRKQHYHIIAQTTFLIALLFILYKL